MQTKNFQTYLEKRLNKNEIYELEQQAEIEFQTLKQNAGFLKTHLLMP